MERRVSRTLSDLDLLTMSILLRQQRVSLHPPFYRSGKTWSSTYLLQWITVGEALGLVRAALSYPIDWNTVLRRVTGARTQLPYPGSAFRLAS